MGEDIAVRYSYLASAPKAEETVMSRQKSLIKAQPGLANALARSAAQGFSDNISRAAPGRSFADILSDLYTQTDGLLAEIAQSGEPALKRAEALKTVAKILPLLQQAEKNARTSIKRKALEEMTDAELEQINRRLDRRARKSRIPLEVGIPGGNTNPLDNSEESNIPPFHTDEESSNE